MKSLTKLKKGIGNNRQLLIGLAIGALVMLPTGLYISERASNNQRTTTPETTTQVQSTTEQTTKQATPQPVITPAPQTAPTTKQVKKFVPSVCTKKYTYRTAPVYVEKDFMLEGEQKRITGYDGWVQTCTRNSDGFKPDDVVLEVKQDEIWIAPKQ